MRDELGTDHLTNERGKIRSDCIHSLLKIFLQFFSEIDLLNDSFRELLDLEDISL